jgi:hypothetical protein
MKELVKSDSVGAAGIRCGTVEELRENGFAFTSSKRISVGDRLRIQPQGGEDGPALTITRMFINGAPGKRAKSGEKVFICCDKDVPAHGLVFKIGESFADRKKQLEQLRATFESWLKQATAGAAAKQDVPKTSMRDFPGFDFDSGAWAKAAKIEPMTKMGDAGKMHKYPTEVKVMHNGETLYVGFRCPYIGQLSANKVSRRDKWPSGDHAEIFIGNEQDGYYHLAFNSFADGENGIYDALCNSSSWNTKWEAKTQVKDGEWRGVAVIPLKSVNIAVEQNNKVRALFYRVRPKRAEVKDDHDEPSTWAGGQVHSAGSFGELRFLHE